MVEPVCLIPKSEFWYAVVFGRVIKALLFNTAGYEYLYVASKYLSILGENVYLKKSKLLLL